MPHPATSPMRRILTVAVLAGLTFTASVTPALACGSITGLDATLIGHCYRISWNEVSGATKYEYEYKPGGYVNVLVSFDTEDNFVSVGATSNGIASAFRVRAVCAGGNGAWSGWITLPSTEGELE